MIFVSLEQSNKPNKKYMIKFLDPKRTIHFGSKKSKTFLDHNDAKKRFNYLKRHIQNEDWNDPLTRGALSAYLLWGFSTELSTNLKFFLDSFNINYNDNVFN
jgi:hypothetical protein